MRLRIPETLHKHIHRERMASSTCPNAVGPTEKPVPRHLSFGRGVEIWARIKQRKASNKGMLGKCDIGYSERTFY